MTQFCISFVWQLQTLVCQSKKWEEEKKASTTADLER